MNQFILALPLRTITVQLQDRHRTQKDNAIFCLYHKMHEEIWKLKKYWLKGLRKVAEQKQVLENCQVAYVVMETEAKRYGRIGGFPDPTEEGEYTLKQKDLLQMVENFTKLADDYNRYNRIITKYRKRGIRRQDWFDELFEDFDEYHLSPIFSNHDFIQIDSVSFDNDFDQFRDSCGMVDKLYDNFMDEWNALGTEVEVLSKKVSDLDVHFKAISHSYNSSNPANFDTTNALLN
jgi:hypothetical protein